jgi:hypothetical protein
MLLDPAQPGTAPALAFLGVTAIGIHPRALVGAEVEPGDPARASGYKLVGRFSDGASIWAVTARPAPAFITLPRGFAAPSRRNGFVGYRLVAPSAAFEIAAKAPGTVRIVLDAAAPEGRKSVLRIGPQVFPIRGRTHVSIVVAVPRGRARLLVSSDPADAVILSAPRAERASGSATLRAQPISANPGFDA